MFCFWCFTKPSQVLETILNDVEEECHFTKSEKEKDELLHKKKIEAKQPAKRMTQISKDCEDNLNIVLKVFIESHATVPSICWICNTMNNYNYIRCCTCVKVCCSFCDIHFHTSTSHHNRDLMQSMNLVKLKAKEFWDSTNDVVVVKGVYG